MFVKIQKTNQVKKKKQNKIEEIFFGKMKFILF